MRKAKLLFLCQYFYPEYNSSATLPYDTARYLSEQGYEVDVLCGYPGEYIKNKNVPMRENAGSIRIRRLRYIHSARAGKLGRLVNYLSFTSAVFWRIFSLRQYDCVVVYSNPPILPIIAVLANALFSTRFVFVAYDIYPEIAYRSGSLSPTGAISRVMRTINKAVSRRCAGMVVLTDEMRDYVLEHRTALDADRVAVIPNWAHEKQAEHKREDKAKLGYDEDAFVVTYFGNMGICQDIETMLEAIQILSEEKGIYFLIAGHGSKLEYLREATAHFPQVQIEDYLVGEEYERALSASSCSIVTLENGLKGLCAPSKYYSYLQNGRPVLAIVEEGSYLDREIRLHGVGASVRPGEGRKLAEAILHLVKNPEDCDAMGERAGRLYRENYSYLLAMRKYASFIDGVIFGPGD